MGAGLQAPPMGILPGWGDTGGPSPGRFCHSPSFPRPCSIRFPGMPSSPVGLKDARGSSCEGPGWDRAGSCTGIKWSHPSKRC